MARRISLRAWAAALLLVVAVGPGAAQQEDTAPLIYKWVDTNGIAHYTTNRDDIPKELRDRLDLLHREREPSPAPVDPEDPWRDVTVEDPADLWVVQDSLGGADDLGSDDPFSEMSARDRAEAQQQEAERLALEQQITQLQAQIHADEDLLKSWIANPEADPEMAADDPEFREVALRLPRLHGDLAALEQKRQAMGGAPADAAP